MTRLVIPGVTPEIANKIDEFAILFAKWNKSINLSAARTPVEIHEHIVDSYAIVQHLMTAATVVDVGSGGGFPVVIAAIACPDTNFTALEPVHKKHAFLRTVARELELVNLDARALRVEDHDVRDYDAATSRATFDLPEWFATGLTLVRPGGWVFGFEAIERTDLPAGVIRHRYELHGKSRAIVALRRES